MTTALRPPVRTVAEVAREAGVAPSAVRFYESRGIVTAVRTAGNQRRFDDHAACRIQVARVAQRIGLTVAEIRGLLADLPTEPRPADWRLLTEALLAEAQRRREELTAALADLSSGRRLCEL